MKGLKTGGALMDRGSINWMVSNIDMCTCGHIRKYHAKGMGLHAGRCSRCVCMKFA